MSTEYERVEKAGTVLYRNIKKGSRILSTTMYINLKYFSKSLACS